MCLHYIAISEPELKDRNGLVESSWPRLLALELGDTAEVCNREQTLVPPNVCCTARLRLNISTVELRW